MVIVQSIFLLLAIAVGIYSFIIFVRVLIGWMGGLHRGPVVDVIRKITDPYLNIFRGLRFLQIGHFDFSVIVGFILLIVLRQVFVDAAQGTATSVGAILGIFFSSLLGSIAFIIGLFGILVAVRLIGLIVGAGGGRFWFALDQIAAPITERIIRAISRGKGMAERAAYGLTAVILIGFAVLIGRLAGPVEQAFLLLPV